MGCDHCLHPLWAGIRCGVCGRWAEEKMEEPSETLKQTWADYQEALFHVANQGDVGVDQWLACERKARNVIAKVEGA